MLKRGWSTHEGPAGDEYVRTIGGIFSASAFPAYGGSQKKIQLDLYTNSQLLFDVTTNTPLRPLAPYDFCLFWDKDTVLGKQLEYRGLRLFNQWKGSRRRTISC